MATQTVIKGVIKVNGVPTEACFDNFSQLLNSLGTYLTVEIGNESFSNIVISVAQPGQADRDKIWWRISNAGSFVGMFFFSNGEWIQVIPAPQQIFWLYGDSDDPPPGYSFALVEPLFTPADYAQLIALAVPNGGTPPFKYFPAIYVGV